MAVASLQHQLLLGRAPVQRPVVDVRRNWSKEEFWEGRAAATAQNFVKAGRAFLTALRRTALMHAQADPTFQ